MNQPNLFDADELQAAAAEPETIAWRREAANIGGSCAAVWWLGNTGFRVMHCGHPTALFPWYVLAPDGLLLLAPNGRGFMSVNKAKSAALDAWWISRGGT